jgi:cytosine/adenosine deaminase-related metal-dependent hydrolase
MDYLSGHIYVRGGFVRGYVGVADGIVAEVSEGRCPEPPVASGIVVPGLVNGHTHAADGGLEVPPGISLEDLVAPPDGLKHRYLRETPPDILGKSMRTFAGQSASYGSSSFVDFREGGEEGCRLLRAAAPEAVILGRPVSPVFDASEVDGILDVADGIGIPSITDVPAAYCEAVADAVRGRGKLLGIHVSERRREDIDQVLSLDPSFVVHMTAAEDGDILKCAEAEVPIVLCPRSNACFGRVPPADRMLDLGADIALGTDNAMLCSPDMRAEAAALRDILSSRGRDPRTAASALLDGGRKILYRQMEIHITIGARADLTILPDLTGDPLADVSDPRSGARRYTCPR